MWKTLKEEIIIIVQKEYKNRHNCGEYPVGIVQKIKIWPYQLVVYAQPRIRPGETHKVIFDFEMQTDHLI